MSDRAYGSRIPIGPKVEMILGLTEPFFESLKQGEEAYLELEDQLTLNLKEIPLDEADEFASILEELLGLDFPDLGLNFFTQAQSQIKDWESRFRVLLAAGNLAMLKGRLSLASELMVAAMILEPDEIAPYVNLAEIQLKQGHFDEALKLAETGLSLEKNHRPLWFFLRRFAISQKAEEEVDKWLLDYSNSKGSWVGLALASYYLHSEDPQQRARLLYECFSQGERSLDFICELSAALGLAEEYDRIESITWIVKKDVSKRQKIPWQIEAHHAQALMALNRPKEALPILEILLESSDLPADAKASFQELKNEALS